MAKKKKQEQIRDREIMAMQTILNTLENLDKAAQQRVLKWLEARMSDSMRYDAGWKCLKLDEEEK